MSIESFRRAAKLYLRDICFVLGSSVILLVLGFTMAIAYRDAIRSWYVDRFGAPAAELLLGITPWVSSLIVLFLGLYLVDRKRGRDPALVCPSCRAQLLQVQCRVIGTGNCPHCGTRILADAPVA